MAELVNDAGTLRFALVQAGEDEQGQVLGAAGLEYLDRRDGGWWPLLRLPVVRLPRASLEELQHEIASLLSGTKPGFSWRPGEGDPVALQFGAASGGAIVEVGLDVGVFLEEATGVPKRPEAELALFRFHALVPSLVLFSQGLRSEFSGPPP